jgi:Mrr N-terminal domain
MAKLPGSVQVEKALKNVSREINLSLKLINSHAGKLLQKGDYAGAETLVEKAKQVGTFRTEVEVLRGRWKELRGSSNPLPAKEQTPLWEYYQPILDALIANGGQSTAPELEPLVQQAMAAKLQPGDLDMMAGDRTKWQVMIKRARRPMVKEGWIEDGSGTTWRITKAGRKAGETEAS